MPLKYPMEEAKQAIKKARLVFQTIAGLME
jgi:hypothetical protein